MNRGSQKLAGVALILAVVAFVALNVLSNTIFSSARVDLTEEGLYTLSDGSKSVLGKLSEPILLQFFFTEDLATEFTSIREYAMRVRDLLEEYVASSNGMLRMEVINPEPFTDAEDLAVSNGLQGVSISSGGERLYFGLAATNTTDDLEVMPFFQQEREPFLEYDLTRLILSLDNAKKPVIGLVSHLPINGGMVTDPRTGQPSMSDPWVVIQQLQQFFDLRDLGKDATTIDEDVDVLMIVHPRDPAPEFLYAVDQFVLAGGKALIFVDPFSEIGAATAEERNPMDTQNSNMQDVFSAWGIELSPGMIVGDIEAARMVGIGGAQRQQAVPYIPWMELREQHFNRDEIVTSQLGRLNVGTIGSFRKLEDGAETSFTPLIQSGPQAMEFERYLVQFRPDPEALLENFVPANEPFTLAARVAGNVQSAFPDGPPGEDGDSRAAETGAGENGQEAAGEDGNTAGAATIPDGHLAESVEPISVLLVADSDILANGRWVQLQDFLGQSVAIPVADNGAFVVNALEVLAGGNDLIGLRTRSSAVREFDVVADLRRNAEARYRETETQLQARLQETESKLAELQGSDTGDAMVLTDEQQATIEEFRADLVSTRRQLRDVQFALREDIENLGVWLKFLNIGLVPVLVAGIAIVVSLVRRHRRRRGVAHA